METSHVREPVTRNGWRVKVERVLRLSRRARAVLRQCRTSGDTLCPVDLDGWLRIVAMKLNSTAKICGSNTNKSRL